MARQPAAYRRRRRPSMPFPATGTGRGTGKDQAERTGRGTTRGAARRDGMTRARRQPRAMGALLRWAIVAIAVAAMLPISPENAGAQGTATITVRSFFE